MKNYLLLFLIHVPLALLALPPKNIEAYPALPGAVASTVYSVKAEGKKIFTEVIPRYDVPVHYARFAFESDKPVSIEISVPATIDSFRISPLSAGITGVKKDRKLVITLSEPRYLVVTINALEYLFLLVDKPEERPILPGMPGVRNVMDFAPDAKGASLSTASIQKAINELAQSGEQRTLYFPAGLYRTGTLQMKSNVSLYLAPGALIKGSSERADYDRDSCLLHFNGVSNMKITGRGCIDGSGWDGLRKNGAKKVFLLFASDSRDILVDGPLLRDPCYWTVRFFRSSGITLRNLKILNNRPPHNWSNTDGIDIDSSTDCLVFNALLHTGDDNVIVKGLDTEKKHNSERIRFEKITGISNSAAVKIGTETRIPLFRQIIFKDIEVVRCKRGIVISGFDSSSIENIQFLNINIETMDQEGSEVTRAIDIQVTDSSFRTSPGRARVKGILIKNLRLQFPVALAPSQIVGRTTEFGVNDVVIQNYSDGGRPFLTPLEAKMKTNEFATGIVFRKE